MAKSSKVGWRCPKCAYQGETISSIYQHYFGFSTNQMTKDKLQKRNVYVWNTESNKPEIISVSNPKSENKGSPKTSSTTKTIDTYFPKSNQKKKENVKKSLFDIVGCEIGTEETMMDDDEGVAPVLTYTSSGDSSPIVSTSPQLLQPGSTLHTPPPGGVQKGFPSHKTDHPAYIPTDRSSTTRKKRKLSNKSQPGEHDVKKGKNDCDNVLKVNAYSGQSRGMAQTNTKQRWQGPSTREYPNSSTTQLGSNYTHSTGHFGSSTEHSRSDTGKSRSNTDHSGSSTGQSGSGTCLGQPMLSKALSKTQTYLEQSMEQHRTSDRNSTLGSKMVCNKYYIDSDLCK